MSKYQDFLQLLKSYCAKKNCPTDIETTLRDASLNDTDLSNPKYITLTQNLNAISMDSIAQNVVRKIYFAGSTKNSDSPASVDAFLIDASGKWYFIEYKNQKLAKTKEKCIEKSYSNVFWLLKILEEMKEEGLFLFEKECLKNKLIFDIFILFFSVMKKYLSLIGITALILVIGWL